MRGSLWLDVQSDKDKAVFNFRVGRETGLYSQSSPLPGRKSESGIFDTAGNHGGLYGSDPACIEVIVQKIAWSMADSPAPHGVQGIA